MKVETVGDWKVLRLPAIDDEGKALWQERFPIERLQKIRTLYNEKRFSGIYQQIPMDTVGHWFVDPIFSEPPDDLKMIGWWDPAFKKESKKKDFNGFGAGNVHEDLFYLKKGEIWRSDLRSTYDKIEKLYFQLGLELLYVEVNQGQDALIIELENRGLRVKPHYSSDSKEFRIENYVKLNWNKIRFSNQVSPEFIKQILKYTELAKHDDAPDTLACLIKILGFGIKAKSLKNRMNFFDLLFGGDW
jgi:hypothetical protein